MRVRSLRTHLSCAFLCLVLGGALREARGQIVGGRYAFAWLDDAPSAQSTALGGWAIRSDARDPALALWNPAALNANADKVVHLGQDLRPGGVGRSTLVGARRFERLGGFDAAAHVQYVGYGDFEGRTPGGIPEGSFRASDYAVGASLAKHIDERLHLGLSLVVVGGSIAEYNSFGLGVSAGVLYTPDSAQQTIWSLQLRNAGVAIDRYADQRDPLPLNLSAGVSKRLAYLPLRVGVLYRHLDRWNLLYDDPDNREPTNLFEEPSERSDASLWFDNFSRHLSLNGELYLGRAEVVQVRFGYDHQRQREGKVGGSRSLAGFSYGLGLNFRRFQLDYGHGVQHLGGGPHHISILLDFAPGERAARRVREERPSRL